MIDTIIVKLAAPCNLRCTYCYEYNSGDESWKKLPKQIDLTVIRKIAERIKEYCTPREITGINIIFHGGEPLLINEKKLNEIVSILREASYPVNLNIGMQTNGTLLNKKNIEVIKNNNIKTGFSIDGNEEQNKLRVDINNKPSFKKAIAGYELLKTMAPECSSGILTVINIDNDPESTIEFLCSLQPKTIDLLLPYETYDSLGIYRNEWAEKLNTWIQTAFSIWFYSAEFSKIKMRIFEDAMQAFVTRNPKTDWFGKKNVSYIVVNTNGEIDYLDILKAIGSNSATFRNINANISNSSIEQAELNAYKLFDKYKINELPKDCYNCQISDICHGGYLTHRFSQQNLFANKSVACKAITGLFSSFTKIQELRR